MNYTLIAKAIAETLDEYSLPMDGESRAAINIVTSNICSVLSDSDPNFDSMTFRCEVSAQLRHCKRQRRV